MTSNGIAKASIPEPFASTDHVTSQNPSYPLLAREIALWRMLTIRFQRAPCSGEGARLYGGRWNARGIPALYLACDPATAVAEFYQGLPKPGTLAPYRLLASALVDLTDGKGGACNEMVEHACTAAWKAMATRNRIPPSWALTRQLIAAGAQGALVPSAQNRGGTCVVLWDWHATGNGPEHPEGKGAALTLLDPEKVLEEPARAR
ncbi:RES family NAD+ phosphorylase [Novosphingobium sp. BW1]|uniref:RES family NAD+ phosphorylase n=1 Tax=Novosphingobium sp. BW1 TaxID=2592621 RepID=UPI0011DEA2AD|nr:RES family NAD+ phosphorylase [Novosphingobium sp. BW1]TYC91677.1 RES domain-containing protein [Novosphingobium sp. BW1]